MSPIDKIRDMLDERGIEHVDADVDTDDGYTQHVWWSDGDHEIIAYNSGERLAVYNLTPEQAIAATVGEEHEMRICKRCGVAYELNIIDKGYGKPRFCPNCGYREMYQ